MKAESLQTHWFFSFYKSQLSSAAATALDWLVVFGSVELLGFWYVVGTALGALAGAIFNFLLNRHWSFRAHGSNESAWHSQATRYALISGASLVLNTGGVYALTELTGIHYSFSVVGVSIAVGFLFNYPMHKHFVFK